MSNKRLLFLATIICLLTAACKPSGKDNQSMNDSTLAKDTIDALDDSDCIFDTSSYKFTTTALLKFDKAIQYKWDKDTKQAKTVLNNGDTLYLSIGGCDHFGYAATLITKTPFNITDSLLNKTRWLAKTFFDNGFESYDQLIANNKFNKSEDSTPEYSAYDVTLSDSVAENCIFEGFSFEKRGNNTIIAIGGYIN